MKRKQKRFFRNGVILLILLSLLAGVMPLQVSAAELTGFTNGAVVRFKNVGSGKYLNVALGTDANGTNVYQYTNDGSVEQTFKLRYNASSDVYLIGAMCSSNGNNRVLDIKRSGSSLKSGMNVQIYTATDATAQQWKFTHYGGGKYIIAPAAKPNIYLTSYGNSNGSGSGTSSTSAGNVFVASPQGIEDEMPVASNNQLWRIEAVQNTTILPSGYYKIKNKNSGLYLSKNSSGGICQTTASNATVWNIEYWADNINCYTIFDLSTYDDAVVSNYGTSMYPSMKSLEFCGDGEDFMLIIKNNDDSNSYRIASYLSYYTETMTVFTGATTSGALVCETGYTGANSQRWIFEEVINSNVNEDRLFLNYYGTKGEESGFLNIITTNEAIYDDVLSYVEITTQSDSGTNQLWKLKYYENGYYIIVPSCNEYSVCLTVDMSVSGDYEERDVVLNSIHYADSQLWKLVYNYDNSITFISKLSYNSVNLGSYYYLSTKDSNRTDYTQNKRILCLSNYNDSCVRWNINNNKHAVFVSSMTSSDTDTYYYHEIKETSIHLFEETFSNYRLYNYQDMSNGFDSDDFINLLKTKDIFIEYNHGSEDVHAINLGSDYVFAYEISAQRPNSFDNLRLAILFSCYAGKGGENESNMATEIYSKGADCVIAWKEEIYSNETKIWLEQFANRVLVSTIADAIAFANDYMEYYRLNHLYELSNISSYTELILGNTNTTLYPS